MTFIAPLLLLLAAEPPPSLAVVVSRRTSVTDKEARVLAAGASKLLAAAGWSVPLSPDEALKRLARLAVKDTADCNGRKPCIAELGKQLGVTVVVALSISAIDLDRGVSLDAIRVADQSVVTSDQLVLSKNERLTADALATFLEALRRALSAPGAKPEPAAVAVAVAPAPVDVPAVAPTPVLTPAPLTPTVKLEAPPPRSRLPAVVTLAGAAAAVAAAVALGVVAGNARGALAPDAAGHLQLTRADADAAVQRANLTFPLSLAFAAVAVGLGATSAVLW